MPAPTNNSDLSIKKEAAFAASFFMLLNPGSFSQLCHWYHQ